jgi:hypothetical protein
MEKGFGYQYDVIDKYIIAGFIALFVFAAFMGVIIGAMMADEQANKIEQGKVTGLGFFDFLSTAQKCSDSDNGNNIYVKGKVTLSVSGQPDVIYSDYCIYAGPISVMEFDCSGSNVVKTQVSCQNGCLEGACLGVKDSSSQNSEVVLKSNSSCALIDWSNESGTGERPEHFCTRKGYSQYVFVVGKSVKTYYESSDRSCIGAIQMVDENKIIGSLTGNFLGYSGTTCDSVSDTQNAIEPYFGDVATTEDFSFKAAKVFCCR